MCVYLFAPGSCLHIDYAAESIALRDGGSEALFDILVTNHSDAPVERVHIIYPHPVQLNSSRSQQAASFSDLTVTWLEERSEHNRFYQTDDTVLHTKAGKGEAEVDIEIPDPRNIAQMLTYRGVIHGKQTLLPFEAADGVGLTEDQWKILAALGWSIFTVKYERAMKKDEARWLRLQGNSGLQSRNRTGRVEWWARRLTGILVHSFEIIGPLDVRHRFGSSLVAAGSRSEPGAAYQFSILELQSMQGRLLVDGLDVSGTTTEIKDWRLNIFDRHYRHFDEPSSSGDVARLGSLNPILTRGSGLERCFQWKAGEDNIQPLLHGGRFTVRLSAHSIPIVTLLLPWIAFFLSLFNLLSRPDVRTAVSAWLSRGAYWLFGRSA